MQLLAVKKSAQEAFLKSILSKECEWWSDFYKCIKMLKGNRENIPAINDSDWRNITYAIEKANTFNSDYSTVFSSDGNIRHIQSENIGYPFTTAIKKLEEMLKRLEKANQWNHTGSLEKFLKWAMKPQFRILHYY